MLLFMAIKRSISENSTHAGMLTLNAIDEKRCLNDLLLSFDWLGDLELVARQSIKLFKSRDFKPRTWVANTASKSVLLNMAKEDLGASLREN